MKRRWAGVLLGIGGLPLDWREERFLPLQQPGEVIPEILEVDFDGDLGSRRLGVPRPIAQGA